MLHFRFNPNFLAWGIAFAFIVPAAAGDWPQWRGPKRDGISTETGLLKTWPSKGPPLAWKANGLGPGYSSVAVVQGRIFTMGDGADSSSVRALDLNGKPLWTAKLGKPGGGDGYPGPRGTPTIDGELVFAIGQYGDLVCVEAATGKEHWRKNLEKDFGGRMMSGWGYSESPLVDGDKLVCTPGGAKGTIVALNKTTGETIWQSKEFTDTAAYASLISSDLGGKHQYIQLTGASVAGVAAENGQLLWKAQRRGSTAVIATPIAWENYVYVTSSYGIGCNLFKVTVAGSEFKAEEVYENKVMANHHGGVVSVGNHVYGYSGDKAWICQEFKTGKMVWEEKGKLGKGSLVYADGHLYLRSEGGKGTVALVEATPSGYKEKGRFDQPGRSDKNSWPHPVIADGKLYLRDQDLLLCYDVKQK
jgi:outer membrane protein assembly factor BamB